MHCSSVKSFRVSYVKYEYKDGQTWSHHSAFILYSVDGTFIIKIDVTLPTRLKLNQDLI